LIVVADTGPLLALAKVNGLDLLRALYPHVFTPPAVYHEAVEAGLELGADDARSLQEVYQNGQLEVCQPTRPHLPVLEKLGRGETQSINLAIGLQPGFLLMDDAEARCVAIEYFTQKGIPTTIKGTLGVIITAFLERKLSRSRALMLLTTLRGRPDIWLSHSLCDRVIELVLDAPRP